MRDGYEGLILRPEGFGYEHRRSKGLLKVKKRMDEEFLVVNITRSVDGWAVLHCSTKDGKLFRASAPGTMLEKQQVARRKTEYIGRYVRIAYPELTSAGIPAQPVALNWRTKETE